jgi:hypothetical protein
LQTRSQNEPQGVVVSPQLINTPDELDPVLDAALLPVVVVVAVAAEPLPLEQAKTGAASSTPRRRTSWRRSMG